MINLDELQRLAEADEYDVVVKQATILKLIEIARAAKLARDALSMPCDRWNKEQSMIVIRTLAAIDKALEGIQ
jgi:hypothetical protein